MKNIVQDATTKPNILWTLFNFIISLFMLVSTMIPAIIPVRVLAADGVPTVNGAFYADSDNETYQFLTESTEAKARVYYYLDENILYLAVVVDPSVNDNVFGNLDKQDTPNDIDYVKSANWSGNGNQHIAKSLVKSDHLSINMT